MTNKINAAKSMVEALEKLAKIERSGALKRPHTAMLHGDIRGVPGGSENCVVAKFVTMHTDLRVEVSVCTGGGYLCTDLDSGAWVRVPSWLDELISDFDRGARPWLYLTAKEW